MEQLSVSKCETPFSRRFTLHEIWAVLDKKYPKQTAQSINMKKDFEKSV